MSKISDFVAQIGGGLARTNRFDIVFTPPSSVEIEGIIPGQQLTVLCEKVQLPGLTVNTTPIRIYGEVRETPYELNYEPINMSFYVDNAMGVKIFFDKWIKSIQDPYSRYFNYYEDYICGQMDIYVQDTLDQDRYKVRLYEVYPKSVSAVQMDYVSKDVMKLDVQMMFKYWRASEEKFDIITQPSGPQIKAPPVKSEFDPKNPYKDPKLPFGLPGIPSDVLKLPKLTSFF
jgi:hypothetical protein